MSLAPRNSYTFKVHLRLCLQPQITDWQRYFYLNCIFRITRGADFGLLTHPGLLLQEESARPEDFTTTCHLRFQQTEVEVYAHFRVPDDNRNQFLVHKKVNFQFPLQSLHGRAKMCPVCVLNLGSLYDLWGCTNTRKFTDIRAVKTDICLNRAHIRLQFIVSQNLEKMKELFCQPLKFISTYYLNVQ